MDKCQILQIFEEPEIVINYKIRKIFKKWRPFMSDDGQETQGVKERFGFYQFIIGWVFLIFHQFFISGLTF